MREFFALLLLAFVLSVYAVAIFLESESGSLFEWWDGGIKKHFKTT